jgi:DnaJ-class molecular chaperone
MAEGVEVECWGCKGRGTDIVQSTRGPYETDEIPCRLCEGTGKAMRFESMDDLIADLDASSRERT